MGDANAEPAPFNPQMAALMGMLIQPRHAKLGLAGKQENWPLAGYALKELRQGFFVIARAVPRWKGLPVPDLFDAAVSQPITQLDFAIKAGEPHQFGEAYTPPHRGLQRLPRHHRSFLRGDQGAGFGGGISQPGFCAEAVEAPVESGNAKTRHAANSVRSLPACGGGLGEGARTFCASTITTS